MTKPVLPFLETMISYGCNLSCLGCTNYSDYDVKGNVSWSDGKSWISRWLERIQIPDFGIIGGEPLMNPEVEEWIVGCRNLMPDAQLRFTTNGIMLHKKQRIIDALMDIGNCVIKFTVHQPQEFYTQSVMQYLFSKAKWEPVTEHGIHRWKADNGVRLQISVPTKFVKAYRNQYTNMLPHNNNPLDAFNICVQKVCPLLFEKNIYKCSTIALLNRTLDDWKIKDNSWDPYKKYQGINPDCDDDCLKIFLDNFGKPEAICAMCPSENDSESIINHHQTTSKKIEWRKTTSAN